jgi:hypothetical protein
MSWTTDPDHPFAGINEKLKRADQNIVNLDAEITNFVSSGKYPTIPHPDDETWQEAVNYHRSKRIPLRFAVLAGEIVHHLRSSLDHVVWHFSCNEARLKDQNGIEFPIFEKEPHPSDKNAINRYNKKIQGITNTQVLGWIKEMQPHHSGADVADDPLLIIHNMDRFDKHRELVIVDSSAAVQFPPTMSDIASKAALYTQGKLPASDHLVLSRALKDHCNVTPNVAFRQFGKRKTHSVIAGLVELFDEVSTLVGVFATEVL